MSPILLATDLSPWCDRAKERAIWLARRDGRPLVVLHVLTDEGSPGDREAVARSRIAEMSADEAADLNTAIDIVEGEPWEEIGAAAKRLKPGIVLLGRHRPAALRDFFLAPTASLVSSGPPILQAVNLPAGPWRRVVVGTDFSRHAQRALTVALDLAGEAPIHLLHTFEVPFAGFITNQVDTDVVTNQNRVALEDAARQAALAAGAQGSDVDLVLARGAVVPTLSAEIGRLGADLLVIATSGSGDQEFGTTAKALTLNPPCDLLVVPPSVQ